VNGKARTILIKHSRRAGRALLVAAALIQASIAYGATFPNLFTVTVASDPQADNLRDAAVIRAMEVLLVRVTGRSEAPAYPELQELIATAAQYMNSYGELDNDMVRVGFNGGAVQGALTQLQWPIWGAERPQVVLWAAIDFGSGLRAVLTSGEAAEAEGAPALPNDLEALRAGIEADLVQAANERGLPMALPVLDLDDFESISFAEIWGGFEPQIMQASARYAADFALTARISLSDFGLEIGWTLISAANRSQTLRTTTLREGIDWAADQFAAQFSSAGGAQSTRIDIEGIDSLLDYGRIMSYLETVSIIETLEVASLSGDVLSLAASIRGDERVLTRVFELGGVLEVAAPVGFPGRLPDQLTGPLPVTKGQPLKYRPVAGQDRGQ
jgi:hypothetical protein